MSILDGIKILEWLTPVERVNLSLFCQEKTLNNWEVLFNQGDEANAMYILKTWSIKIFENIDGKEIVLWQVKAEELLWEMAVFWDSNTRMASAEAMEDCVMITILSFSVDELTQKYPEIRRKIESIISQRVVDNEELENNIRQY